MAIFLSVTRLNALSISRPLLLALLLAAGQAKAATVRPARTTNDLDNPHKGFMLWGTDYALGPPDNFYGATLYHVYAPWREIETSDQVFDWGRFETNHLLPILADHPDASFVLRPVADYPDGENSGISAFYSGGETSRDFPRFLIEPPLSIPYYPYENCDGDGPGWTPDWNHPAMQTQLVQFIQAFAARYDGDPRITAVQTGLLGLWGEWHQSGCEAHAPSNTVKIAVRDAYAASFSNTPLQTRYAKTPDADGVDFGFHEDFFPSFTAPCLYGFPECSDDGDWNLSYGFQHLVPAAAENWRSNPVSGESPLLSQKRAWSNDVADVMTVLSQYHFSFLGPAGGHEYNGNHARLVPMKRILGYNYHVDEAILPNSILLGVAFPVEIALANSGSASCYHRFPVELALCGTNGIPAWRQSFAFDLRELGPASTLSIAESFSVSNLPPGTYSLRVGILDPRSGEPGIRIQSAPEDPVRRIVLGNVAVANPWQTDIDADGIPDGWELRHFPALTNAAHNGDWDRDGQSDYAEYVADTDPADPDSFFPRLASSLTPTGVVLRIEPSSTSRTYSVERKTNLLDAAWTPLPASPGAGGPWTHSHPSSGFPTLVFRSQVAIPASTNRRAQP